MEASLLQDGQVGWLSFFFHLGALPEFLWGMILADYMPENLGYVVFFDLLANFLPKYVGFVGTYNLGHFLCFPGA